MKHALLPLALAGALAAPSHAAEALATSSATLELSRPACTFSPQLFLPNWQQKSASGGLTRNDQGAFPFVFSLNNTDALRGSAVFFESSGGAIDAAYTFIPADDLALNSLFVGTSFSISALAGGTWTCDSRSGAFPAAYRDLILLAASARSLTLAFPNGQRLAFAFPEPTGVLIQDDRQWGPTFSLRIGHNGGKRTFKAGKPFAVRFSLRTDEAQHLTLDSPVTIRAGNEWIPLKEENDIVPGSALDFSALKLTETPAGKYGRVVAKGPHFEFERKPGVPQRFYGVNLCFSANFFAPDQSARLIERLARTGYNAVRLHHYDGGLVEGSKDGTTLNPERLARFDALIAACVSNGLYVTTDLYVSRSVPWRSIGIDRDGAIAMNEYKVLVPIHEGAWNNFKDFSRQLLTHVNPYTGRRYADEPALAWLSMINEGNFGNYLNEMRGIPEWQRAWRTWLKEKQAKDPARFANIPDTLPGSVYGSGRHVSAFVLFLQEVEAKMIARMKTFLRDELGCRALITDRNAWTNFAADQVTREEAYDYVDDHFYVDHPKFIEHPWRLPSQCANVNPLKNDRLGAQNVVFTRLLDKPFTITEYNYAAPGRFRGVGGILTGAMGALQDWAGVWRFAYSHNAGTALNPEGSALNYFDMASDPLSQAAERATLCLFLRGDLAPLSRTYALVIPARDALQMRDVLPHNRAEWPWLAWYARMGTIVADAAPAGTTWSDRFPEAYSLSSEDQRNRLGDALSSPGDGAVSIDPATGTFVLNTARTCGGFTETGAVKAGALTFDVGGTAATVWVSSLDGQPVKTSSRLLLVHLTDVQNSGIHYAQKARKTLLAWGGMPHLVRSGTAEIRLAVVQPKGYKVYALSTGGRRVAEVPCREANGRLTFSAAVAGPANSATMLYEIVRK